MEFKLAAKINLTRASETDDERYTVRQLKTALNRLGYYMPDPNTGITDDIDENLKDAVHAYQRKSTIFYNDVDLGPGSTTERILNQDLTALDEAALYIWRTVGDEKVRGSHAVRNGQTFSWSAPPEGGHPSEDYNCRCWAEHTNPPYHPWIEWARERRELRAKLAPPLSLKTDPLIEEPKLTAGEIARYAVTVAAVLITLRSGGKVPLKKILSIVKAGKNNQSLRRLTVDRHLFKKPEGIPDDWVAKPLKKGIGIEYVKPGTKNGTYVRLEKGNSESTMPGQKYDNVRWQKNGKSLDVNGNIVEQKSPESHIPIKDFKFDITKVQ